MKSAGVCISIPVRNMAMHSSAKYFATMTGIAEDGTVCHDTIEKVTEKHFL